MRTPALPRKIAVGGAGRRQRRRHAEDGVIDKPGGGRLNPTVEDRPLREFLMSLAAVAVIAGGMGLVLTLLQEPASRAFSTVEARV